MYGKRMICLLLAILTVCSLAACGDKIPEPVEPTKGSVPQEPAVEPPLKAVDFQQSYLDLTDVTEQVNTAILGMPSTQIPAEASVTEFTTVDQLHAQIDQYADLGIGRNTDWTASLDSPNNRCFLLANKAYSTHMIPKISKVTYDEAADTLCLMLDHTMDPYAADRNAQDYRDIVNNAKAAYYAVAMNFDGGFSQPVEHILFVSPEQKAITRTDLNCSVIGYDEAYKSLKFYDLANGGVDTAVYSFPSMQAPTETKLELITSRESFLALRDQYNDIVDSQDDTLILEPGFVEFNHRDAGLFNASEFVLLNLFLSSPELDPVKSLQCAQFSIRIDWYSRYTCGQFYDDQTQTVYIYLEYAGDHADHEKYSDGALIQENSNGTYVMLSVAFHKDSVDSVKNVVFVLPETT